MSKTVLEQALDHLLNKEEDKATALLHDYYVGIGRKVYEDIMADEEMFDETSDVSDNIDEVDAELTEEGDEVAPADGEGEGEGEVAAAAELGAELGAEEGEAAPVSADAADVADAMMDVESALAKLKAEFEQMASGEASVDEVPADEVPAKVTPESIEESAELSKVSSPDNSDKADEKHSPVAGKNPMMARPAVKIGAGSAEGVASGTSPAKAPAAQDLGGTTKPALSKVSTKG